MALSLAMIVKNGGVFLKNCLASVQNVCDEIVIVDTGSEDDTREIALSFGARFFSFEWKNDFSAARNYSLEQVRTEWVLVLDSDEKLSSESLTWFREIQKSDLPSAWKMVTRNFFSEKPDIPGDIFMDSSHGIHPGWFIPSEKVRFFKKISGVSFTYPLHEVLEPSLSRLGIPIFSSPVIILHFGYLHLTPNEQEKKGIQYETILREYLANHSGNEKTFFDYAYQCFLLKNYAKSAVYFERAKNCGLENPLLDVLLIKSFFEIQQIEKAIFLCEKVDENHQFYDNVCFLHSACLEQRGKLADSIKILRKLLTLTRNEKRTIYLKLGKLFKGMGNYDMAREYMKRASETRDSKNEK